MTVRLRGPLLTVVVLSSCLVLSGCGVGVDGLSVASPAATSSARPPSTRPPSTATASPSRTSAPSTPRPSPSTSSRPPATTGATTTAPTPPPSSSGPTPTDIDTSDIKPECLPVVLPIYVEIEKIEDDPTDKDIQAILDAIDAHKAGLPPDVDAAVGQLESALLLYQLALLSDSKELLDSADTQVSDAFDDLEKVCTP